jgi:hypothetical protein
MAGSHLKARVPATLPSLLVAVIGLFTIAGLPMSGGVASADHAAAPAAQTAPAESAAPVAGDAAVAPAASAVVVSVAGTTPSAVSLSWTETSDGFFSQYTVLESTNGTGGPWQSVGVVTTKTTTAFAVTGLSPGANYTWEIQETGLFGSTADSNAVLSTQPNLAFLEYRVLSSTSIQLNWTNNASYGGLLSFDQYQVWVTSSGATSSQAILTSAGENSTVVNGLGAGTNVLYYLNTTDCVSGCVASGGSDLTTSSNAVTYGTPLALGATLVADRVVVDGNQSDLFTCTPSGGESPFNFTWQIGSGSFAADPSSTSFAFPLPGPVTVTCWVQDSLGSHLTTSTTVQVNSDPSVLGTANRTAVDVGQSVTLSCSATLGTGPYTFTWASGAGTLLSGAIVPNSYASPGTVTATCFAVDSTGTTSTASVSIVVSPSLAANVASSSSAAAPQTTLTFTATGINGSGGYGGFAWDFGDGGHGTGASVTHGFATVANFTVSVTLNDSNGARASATLVVDVTPIKAVVTPFVSALSTGGWWNATASASGGAGAPYTYSWSLGDGTNVTGAGVSHEYPVAGTYPIQVTVHDRLGSMVAVSVTTVTVTAPPVPPRPSKLPMELELVALGLLILAILIGLVLLVRRRRREEAYPLVAGRVPAADPAASAKGTKICPTCGTANVATRKTCQACGASLGRSIMP